MLLKLSKNKQGYAEVSVSTNMDTASTWDGLSVYDRRLVVSINPIRG